MGKPGKLAGLTANRLHYLYYEEHLSQRSIANILGCDPSAIQQWFRKFNIPTRTKKEQNKLASTTRKAHHIITFSAKGELNPNWQGGRYSHRGYNHILRSGLPSGHPATNEVSKKGYIPEHIAVWEHIHNRLLPKGWVVHHLNGIKTDNRPQNLVAMARNNHLHLAEPYKKRIRELEAQVKLLEKALEANQLIFNIGEN